MGQQISAAAESAGHPQAHLALGESQVKTADSRDSGAKSLSRRGHPGLIIPTAAVVPAKVDGLGPGEKSLNKADQEIGRMSIRAAIDSFIENCLSSNNENSEKHLGDDLDSVHGLGRLSDESRSAGNTDLMKSGKKSPGARSESGVESISSDSTDIQEADLHDDPEEKQLVIDCDGSLEPKMKNEPREGSHNHFDGLASGKSEKNRVPLKETSESSKMQLFSPSLDKPPFQLYVQDQMKKSCPDLQDNGAQSKESLQSHSQSISREMAKKSTDDASSVGGSEYTHGPVRLQTLIDKVLDQSLTNQDAGQSVIECNSKKGERSIVIDKSDDRMKETGLASNKKGYANDASLPEMNEAPLAGDKKEADSKKPAKSTLCFKDHIEKVLLESFLSYEEEERRDALKRGENPDDVSKASIHADMDAVERQNTKREGCKSGAERPVNVQDIVDRVISQTQVISKLMTPEGQATSQPQPVQVHPAQPHTAQPHSGHKYQNISTPTKVLQEAQRYAVHKEHQSSNIGRKRGRPRLGSPGIWPANELGKEAKAAYAEQRAREYRNSQGPPPHHLPQQLPHMPTHQDRLGVTSIHGSHPRAPLPVDYHHPPSQAYGMSGSSVYQHRHSQQRQPGIEQPTASKPGMPPGMLPASSAYHHSSQEPFHTRGTNLQQQSQGRSHQHHGHPKPPPPLILADNIGDKNSLSRIVPVSHMPTKSCSCHSCVSHFSQASAPHPGQKQERSAESQSHYPSYQLTSRRNLPHPSGAETLRPVLTISGQSPYPSHAIIPSYVSGHRQHDGPPNGQQSGTREGRYYDSKGRNPSPGHYPAYSSQMTVRQDVGYSESGQMSSRQDSRYPDKSPVSRQDSRYPENFHLSSRQESRYTENSQVPSRESRYPETVQASSRQESRYPDNGHVPRQEARYSDSSQSLGRTEARYTDHMPRQLEPYDLTDPARHSNERIAQPIVVDTAASPTHVRLSEGPASSEGDQPLDLSVKPVITSNKEVRRKPSETALEISGHGNRQSYRTVSSELPAGGNYLDYDQRAPPGHHLQRLENSVDRFLPQNPLPQFRQSTSQSSPMDTRERHNAVPLPNLRERHTTVPQLLHPPESPSHKSVRHALPSPSLPPSSQHAINPSASPVGHPYSSNMSPGGVHRPDSSPSIHHFHTSDSHLKQTESIGQRPSSHNSDVEMRIVQISGQRSPSPDESDAQRMGVSKHEPIQNIIGSHPPSDILYLICRLCRQTYGSPYGFRKHFRNQHGFEPKAEHTIVQTISATKTAMANSVESLPQSPVVEYSSMYEDGKRDLAGQPNVIGLDDMKLDIKSDYTKYLECPECQQLFRLNDFGSYKRHCRQHSLHRMSGPFACHECQKCFSEPGSLQEHLETHSNFTTSVCGICQNYFSSPSYLAEHIKAAHQLVYPGDRPDKASSEGSKRIKEELSPQPESLLPPPEVSRESGSSSQVRATANHLPLTKRHRQFSPASDAQMFTVHTPKGLEIEKLPADGVVTTASPDSSYDDCQPGSAGAQVDTPAGESESARLVTGQGVKVPGLTKTPSSEVLRSQSKDDTESNSSDCSANLESQSTEGSHTNSSEDIEKFYKHKKYSRYRKRSSPTNLTEPDKKVAKTEDSSTTKEPGASVTSSAAVTSTFNSGVTLQDCESSCQQSEDSNSSSCFKSPAEDVKKQAGSSTDKAKSKEDGAKSGSDEAGTKFKWDRLTRSQAGKAIQSVSYTSS